MGIRSPFRLRLGPNGRLAAYRAGKGPVSVAAAPAPLRARDEAGALAALRGSGLARRNVAAHLAVDGVFALEAFVPDVARFDRRQRVGAIKLELDGVQLEATSYDAIGQRATSQTAEVAASPPLAPDLRRRHGASVEQTGRK